MNYLTKTVDILGLSCYYINMDERGRPTESIELMSVLVNQVVFVVTASTRTSKGANHWSGSRITELQLQQIPQNHPRCTHRVVFW